MWSRMQFYRGVNTRLWRVGVNTRLWRVQKSLGNETLTMQRFDRGRSCVSSRRHYHASRSFPATIPLTLYHAWTEVHCYEDS
jgi:hypothetical protein